MTGHWEPDYLPGDGDADGVGCLLCMLCTIAVCLIVAGAVVLR